MDTLESLSAGLKTTEGIRSIVRTMKSLSAASIHQYEQAASAIAEYSDTVDQGLQVMLRGRKARSPTRRGPLAGPNAPGRGALIVIGSDRGLCGRFNDRIATFASEQFLEPDDPGPNKPLLTVLGVRAAARLSAEGHEANHLIALPGSAVGLSRTAQDIIAHIEMVTRTGNVTRVDLVHNRRGDKTASTPVARRLMPLDPDFLEKLAHRPWPSRSLPTFRMEHEALVAWLLREHIYVAAFRALAESLASEHASRLASMQSAERNISDRQEDLLARFRQKRQESITRELLDIIAGFETTQPQQQT